MTKTDLQALIDQANALNEQDYTTDSWDTLVSGLSNAQTVYDDPEATQAEIDNAHSMLGDGIDQLVERADKTYLVSLLQQADALVEGDYTSESWDNLQSAYNSANNVNNNPNVNQTIVDSTANSLATAIDDLVEKADKTALVSLLQQADALVESDYTPGTWADLENAYTAASDVNDTPDASQTVVDSAASDLSDAIDGLVEAANTAALDSSISAAQALVETDYTPSTWSNLVTALDTAVTVSADEAATQTEVDNAQTNLDTAVTALVERADKTDLIAAIQRADTFVETDYTPDSWSAIETAYTAATTANADDETIQSEADTATTNLNTALDAAVDRATFTALQTLVDEVNALPTTGWSTESYSELTTRLSEAEAVLSDLNSTQTQVDTAEFNLRYAQALLLSTEGCQLPFNSDDDEFLDPFAVDPFVSPDSTQRRISLTADGTEYNVGIYTSQDSPVGLNQPWRLAARAQAALGDEQNSGGVSMSLIAVDTLTEEEIYRATVSFDGTVWTAHAEKDGSATTPVTVSEDVDFGVMFSLINEEGELKAAAGSQQIDSFVLSGDSSTVRFLLTMSIPDTAVGGTEFTLDALTNEYSPDICSALFQPDEDEGRSERELGHIQELLNDYVEAAMPGKTVPIRELIRHHLSLAHAFRIALSHDDRVQRTGAMDKFHEKFNFDKVPQGVILSLDFETQEYLVWASGLTAFDPAYTQRFMSTMKELYPKDTEFLMECLKTAYETRDGVVPGWLQCNADKITDCLPETLAMRYLDYLNHV